MLIKKCIPFPHTITHQTKDSHRHLLALFLDGRVVCVVCVRFAFLDIMSHKDISYDEKLGRWKSEIKTRKKNFAETFCFWTLFQ